MVLLFDVQNSTPGTFADLLLYFVCGILFVLFKGQVSLHTLQSWSSDVLA